ncbi:hypothetical protein LXL04_010131 [Taraxacum kok-saghyz]
MVNLASDNTTSIRKSESTAAIFTNKKAFLAIVKDFKLHLSNKNKAMARIDGAMFAICVLMASLFIMVSMVDSSGGFIRVAIRVPTRNPTRTQPENKRVWVTIFDPPTREINGLGSGYDIGYCPKSPILLIQILDEREPICTPPDFVAYFTPPDFVAYFTPPEENMYHTYAGFGGSDVFNCVQLNIRYSMKCLRGLLIIIQGCIARLSENSTMIDNPNNVSYLKGLSRPLKDTETSKYKSPHSPFEPRWDIQSGTGLPRKLVAGAEIPEKCRTGISSSTWCARALFTVRGTVAENVGRCREVARASWIATRFVRGGVRWCPGIADGVRVTSDRDQVCPRSCRWCPGVADGVRVFLARDRPVSGYLVQTFYRTPGVRVDRRDIAFRFQLVGYNISNPSLSSMLNENLHQREVADADQEEEKTGDQEEKILHELIGFGAPTCTQVVGVNDGDTCFAIEQGFNITSDFFDSINPNLNCTALFIVHRIESDSSLLSWNDDEDCETIGKTERDAQDPNERDDDYTTFITENEDEKEVDKEDKDSNEVVKGPRQILGPT